MSIILDLGCGNKKHDSSIGLDIVKLKGVNIICDLNKRIPLKDNSVDGIYTSHFLEHCNDFIFMMEEIWRICKPKGKITIIVPYFASTLAYQDPTHNQFFTEFTFDYFTKDPKRRRPATSNYSFCCDFKILKVDFEYAKPFRFLRFLPNKMHLGHFFIILYKNLK